MAVPAEKEAPCKENIAGTYEEMFSNWRNKVQEAAEAGDLFASFVNTLSCQMMLSGMASELDLSVPNMLTSFDPEDLSKNGREFDRALRDYLGAYDAVGMQPLHFANVDEYVAAYLK